MTYQEQYQSSLNEINAAMQKNRPARKPYKARKWRKNQMTNYEKIKSMSIDKMAEIIAYNFDESPSLSQVKVWLKAESEEE